MPDAAMSAHQTPQENLTQRLDRKQGLDHTRVEALRERRRLKLVAATLFGAALAALWVRHASFIQAVVAVLVAFSSLVFVIHNAILLPFSLWYRKEKVRTLRDEAKSRFAILVPAHNEEAVVGALVDNLLALDYPKNLYDVYVIADNCTDRTAEVARAHGALVYERFDPMHRTKAHALRWMIDGMEASGSQYDALVVIDADNLVDPRYLLQMNRRLQCGERLIQGYLDVKNPFDSWISASVAVGYWSTNRLWQLPKYRLGLSAALGGTGMCIETRLLRRLGWSTGSFTEDLDFQCRALLAGVRTTWAHEARVYDEKPTGLRSSMRQRERWMIGHNACRRQYLWPLLKKGLFKLDLPSLDSALYLMYPMLTPAWLLMIGLILLGRGPGWLLASGRPLHEPFLWYLTLAAGTYGFPTLGLLLHGAPRRIYRTLWYYPVYCLTWIPVVMASFLNRQRTWAHTQHTRDLALTEVLRERIG